MFLSILSWRLGFLAGELSDTHELRCTQTPKVQQTGLIQLGSEIKPSAHWQNISTYCTCVYTVYVFLHQRKLQERLLKVTVMLITRMMMRSDIVNFFVFYEHDDDTSTWARHHVLNLTNYNKNGSALIQQRLLTTPGYSWGRTGWNGWNVLAFAFWFLTTCALLEWFCR